MFNLAKRNLRIFFRQKTSVFFSLLGVFIVIGLYVLFLGDVWQSSLEQMNIEGIEALMANWIMAGVVSITPVTTAMGAFGIMVEDESAGSIKDFYTAPVKRTAIVGGYVISACTISLALSLVAFALGEIYIVSVGGSVLAPVQMIKMLGAIAGSVLMSGAMIFFVASFIKSNNAFATLSNIIGALIGFVTGIYLPMDMLPDAVKWVVKLFPPSHASALMRQIMMKDSMAACFNGAPAEYLTDFKEAFGVVFTFGSYTAAPQIHTAVILISAAVFFALAVLRVRLKNK